jgi:hypothetical protein
MSTNSGVLLQDSFTLICLRFFKKGDTMNGTVQFIRSLILVALLLGTAGTLVEATGFVGKEAAKAHQHGGISFRSLNRQLIGK